jgi:hypothetical protein
MLPYEDTFSGNIFIMVGTFLEEDEIRFIFLVAFYVGKEIFNYRLTFILGLIRRP